MDDSNSSIKEARYTTFTSKEILFYKSIDRYFRSLNHDLKNKMIDIIENNHR